MKRVRNISRKDELVVQTRAGVDPDTVDPSAFEVVNGGNYHVREESSGKSPFTGRGASTNGRPMKGDPVRASAPAAAPPRPQAAPRPAADVEVLSPDQHVVGRAASQPAFRVRQAKQDAAEPLDIDGQADPNDFVVGHSVVVPGGKK